MYAMFFLLKICGPPNDIISFFGPLLKKFSDPCTLDNSIMNLSRYFSLCGLKTQTIFRTKMGSLYYYKLLCELLPDND